MHFLKKNFIINFIKIDNKINIFKKNIATKLKMKTIILAGGLGTRLSEETRLIPKPLILIGKKPILFHIMNIYSSYGFNDFIICTGYKSNLVNKYFESLDHEIIKNNKNVKVYHIKKTNWKVTLAEDC